MAASYGYTFCKNSVAQPASPELSGSTAQSAGTPGQCMWPGGRGVLKAHATWGGGNIQLQQLSPDGSTFVPITGATLTADGTVAFDAGPGLMQLQIVTATGVYAGIDRVVS